MYCRRVSSSPGDDGMTSARTAAQVQKKYCSGGHGVESFGEKKNQEGRVDVSILRPKEGRLEVKNRNFD